MNIETYKLEAYSDGHIVYVIESCRRSIHKKNTEERKAMARELIAAAEFFLEGIKDETNDIPS